MCEPFLVIAAGDSGYAVFDAGGVINRMENLSIVALALAGRAITCSRVHNQHLEFRSRVELSEADTWEGALY